MMKEEIIFRLPGISLKEITETNNAPLAFNDIQPMNIVDEVPTESFKETQSYIIQRDETLIEKKIKDIMIQYQYCNQTGEWPTATQYNCFWCCHSFKTIPCFIPISIKDNLYKVYGNFCSFNCCLAYNFNSSDVNYSEKSSLIQDLYFRIYGYDAPKLSYAPPKEILEIFGGSVTIEEYRESFKTLNDFKLTLPNIIFNIPQLMEEKRLDIVKKPVELQMAVTKPINKINVMNSLVTSMGIRKK